MESEIVRYLEKLDEASEKQLHGEKSYVKSAMDVKNRQLCIKFHYMHPVFSHLDHMSKENQICMHTTITLTKLCWVV